MKLGRRAAVLIGALVLLAAGLVAMDILRPARAPLQPQASFPTLRHGVLTSQSLHGRPVLVTFWATSCTICLSEMPRLVDLYRRYHDRGLEIVAVAMPYDAAWLVASYATSRALPFPVAFDANGALVRSFGGVEATPTAFLLDRRGVVLQRIQGRPDFADLERRVERSLGEI